ncbi:MAG: hypothetical protein ACYS1A_10635 [Planctomycetota bacterium]|jgi:hypothetical protein
MKLDYLKDKKEFISVVLLGVSAVLAVCILVDITGFFVASARAGNLVKNAVAQTKPDKDQMDKYFAKSREMAEQLKKKNLFVQPPPKQQPIKQVLGILGNEVLINGKWYKVGDMVKDAKIVAVEPAQIKIEWDGKKITLAPISATGSSPAGVPAPAKQDSDARRQRRIQSVESGQMPRRRGGGRGRGMGGFGNLSPEERAAMMERFRNASDEERQQMRGEMRERFRSER